MKKIRNVFVLCVLCSIGQLYSMEEKGYSSCKKNSERLRSSKEKEKSDRHITRKKARRPLISSKEEYIQNFFQEWEEEVGLIKEKRSSSSSDERKSRRRSHSFSITKPTRRSSTGQIDKPSQKIETETYCSPRLLRRENSKGSIEVLHGSPKWHILNTMRVKQDEAKKMDTVIPAVAKTLAVETMRTMQEKVTQTTEKEQFNLQD